MTAEGGAGGGRPLRILLVEDSLDDAALIERALRRSLGPVELRRVEREEEVRETLQEGDWQIVLSDFALPGFNAEGTLRAVQELAPGTPCLIVSGAVGEEAAVELLKAGATDFVNKDNLVRLPPAVERALEETEQRHARERAERALRESEERFRLITENASDLITVTTPDGRFAYLSPSFERVLGYRPAELSHLGPGDLVHPDDRRQFTDWGRNERREFRIRRADGTWLWIEGSSFEISWRGQRHIAVIARDTTERRRLTERLTQLAYYDPLTLLPNRSLLLDRLRQALAHARRGRHLVALLFMDFDNFKILNDSLGHAFGDRVLQVIGERLAAGVRDEDTVARLGGDEFVVVLPALESMADAEAVAYKLLERLSSPFEIEGQEVQMTASIGLAASDGHSPEAPELLKHADLAMYRAKEGGKGHVRIFTPSMTERAISRLHLERELRRALDNEEFELHYQPRMDLTTNRITGFEALVRWRHPERGVLPPSVFLPLAEETGLIHRLGEQILLRACEEAVTWAPVSVAVNLSTRQLQRPAIVEEVARILEQTGLDPNRLELEISEGAAVAHLDEATATLEGLEALGVRIVLDDFGTGYASLAYLRTLPITSIKLDRSFVEDITTAGEHLRDEAIVRAVVSLGKSLDLRLVGEGIESAAQLEWLRDLGFDEGQGFLFGGPLQPNAVMALLASQAQRN